MSKLQIINDSMTLDEKLSAINAAMKAIQQIADDDAKQSDTASATPADLVLATTTGCE